MTVSSNGAVSAAAKGNECCGSSVLPRDLIEFISGGHCSEFEFRQGRVLPDKVEARLFLFVLFHPPVTVRCAEKGIRAVFSLPVTFYDLTATRP